MSFSSLQRTEIKKSLSEQEFDVLIIGGGITGAGIALDASSRGLKTALIEKQDFAAGTSSRSTKLVHGGLRYLENFEFKLVRDVGQEREIIHRNAPHLVIPTKMLLPIVKKGSLNKFTTNIGLSIYDFLAGVRKSERKIMLSKSQTINKEPLLNKNILTGSALYYEYKTDDARLVIETLKKASSFGAVVMNYCPAKNFTYSASKISGANVYDLIDNVEFQINAKIVINATGPWVDRIRTRDDEIKGKKLHITKGVHLVFPRKKFQIYNANYFDVGDGRMIFAIPKKQKVYVGTTDTNYNDSFEFPRVSLDDTEYLLNAINKMFSGINLSVSDIESSWAGLRPLIHEEGKKPSEISRKNEIFTSTKGLISIAGGKLTGYRKMSEKIVNLVFRELQKHRNISFVKCKTKNIPLCGANFGFYPEILNIVDYADSKYDEVKQTGISILRFKSLFYRYGSNIDQIISKAYDLYNHVKDAELAFLKAEIWYSINFEMTTNLSDFFIRRTEMLFFERDKVIQFMNIVANEMTEYFNWTVEERNFYVENCNKQVLNAVSFE